MSYAAGDCCNEVRKNHSANKLPSVRLAVTKAAAQALVFEQVASLLIFLYLKRNLQI